MPDARGGATDLHLMLAGLDVSRRPGVFTMVSVADESSIPDDVERQATIREAEGWTIVCTIESALRLGAPFEYRGAWLTVQVHSALDAVGLTAAISTELARHGLSCNMLAGAFHDHLLVAEADADRAMEILHALRDQYGSLEPEPGDPTA